MSNTDLLTSDVRVTKLTKDKDISIRINLKTSHESYKGPESQDAYSD